MKKSIGERICRSYTYPMKLKFKLEKEKKKKRVGWKNIEAMKMA